MKTLFLTVVLLVAGIVISTAQTNPTSTNGVDTETQLAWPDGRVYTSAINDTDYQIGNVGTTNPVTFFDIVHWDITAGGTQEVKDYSFNGTSLDDVSTWLPAQWPEYGVGTLLSLNGATNLSWIPAHDTYLADYNSEATYGDFNNTFGPATAATTYKFSDKAEITLITGGAPGSSGSEFYMIYGTALNVVYDAISPSGRVYPVRPEQISIANLGNLTLVGTNQTGFLTGQVWTTMPLNTQQSLTPRASGSGYNEINVNAQSYQLVSQCVATTPGNRARTTLGVGEQVILSFSPTMWTNATWKASGGGLALTTGLTNLFTAPSNAPAGTKVSITATVAGKTCSPLVFNIVEPSGGGKASVTGTNHFPVGNIGAGMTNAIWLYPTNVSFYRLYLIEIPCVATNISGYFTNVTIPTPTFGNTQVGQDNSFEDRVSADFSSYALPFYYGQFEFDVNVKWQILGSSITNNLGTYPHVNKLLDADGDFSVSKYGVMMTRTLDDISHSSN